MIYQSAHQAATMSSIRKTSPRPQHRKFQTTASKSQNQLITKYKKDCDKTVERCRGRCRVEWSEKHVKEGLVLVQEAQLARVVKNGPITEHYEIDPKPFASGQWASVYKCRSRLSGTMYAAKYSSRNRFNTDCSAELRHEIALLSLCSQSPRVVRLHDVYETPKEIILVMEFAPGGDLQTLIDGDLVPLEGDVVHFVKQLVEGLAYLHERNIAHLDIKPQNLVMMGSFPECEVKLCDFEISRVVLEGTEVREILGTPDYVAPEILHYEPITLAADMWSLGVTTYVLLTGFSPFGGETDQETFQNISVGEVDFPEELFEDISVSAKDFVAKLLVLDPSARMSAKQCLRHDWLRDAPTQASPHLRRYLSKSREVLLERVVSRENLRRAALISQATSHANLTESELQKNPRLVTNLSQSEMCLNQSLTSSHGSLTNSECYMSPADSQTSLNSSQTSLTMSQASLGTSQNYLLNKEQTQGLLSQAQSRSQANLNHVNRRGLLSRMRSLNQIQSQACLLNNDKIILQKEQFNNSIFGNSRSQEKLYGLKCLSKSQGVLDIYRSLESLKKTKKFKKKEQQRPTNNQDSLPVIKNLENEIKNAVTKDNDNSNEHCEIVNDVKSDKSNELDDNVNKEVDEENREFVSEENFDSLQSVESDTLTEDSDVTSIDATRLTVKQPSKRQNSDISSHSNNSGNSDDKDEHYESENDEPKYSVSQLVSAFNKHQEVASKTSLEAIMTEKCINEVTFPTGPKALRLFIPDINITERVIVKRKTSYKPRKNWEELRKRNEKNEGVLKDFDNDSGNEDDEDTVNPGEKIDNENSTNDDLKWTQDANDMSIKIEDKSLDNRDTTIDEKYKQCVDVAKKEIISNETTINSVVKPTIIIDKTMTKTIVNKTNQRSSYQKERLPNYIHSDVITSKNNDNKNVAKLTKTTKLSKVKKPIDKRSDSAVNLKDILQKTDNSHSTQKENMEKLRKRTSIAKIILNDNLSVDSDSNNNINKTKNDKSINNNDGSNQTDVKNTKINNTRKLSNNDSSTSKIETSKTSVSSQHDGKKIPMSAEERRMWGKVCTGSYTRAMEKFNSKPNSPRKSLNLLSPIQNEKIRRKSSPAMPPNSAS
ncbi:5'-AMP-activated serine/threonine-protein kinase catalytic subunit alpha-like [Aphidius gifuensis]|uniref:5'-AMP-activated serine/threonine-protein kinase catalytic subunit alpha-like n=1 Tax=Aphidius gifuensis TaxID=684658 RepID=UPI001CDB5A46|nr:5'-AMP-activated serine/threonine-protein kinase catalytic subunit alpha-like [Aphidius gifuensis]